LYEMTPKWHCFSLIKIDASTASGAAYMKLYGTIPNRVELD
jgi:hypothetical protein